LLSFHHVTSLGNLGNVMKIVLAGYALVTRRIMTVGRTVKGALKRWSLTMER